MLHEQKKDPRTRDTGVEEILTIAVAVATEDLSCNRELLVGLPITYVGHLATHY